MNGHVDDAGRALLTIEIASTRRAPNAEVVVWIDTAFDGHLMLPSGMIKDLELEPLAQTEGILADGSRVVLEAFFGYVDWFGQKIPLQVIANEGRMPLLGTAMLAGRVLQIDYREHTVTLI